MADYPGFLRPHRSYLVNVSKAEHHCQSITMESLAQVPRGPGRFTAVRISIWNTPLRERRSSWTAPGILPEGVTVQQ